MCVCVCMYVCMYVYTNDIAFLVNKTIQAESLLHSLEWAAGDIGLYVNTDKTEFMCFNQRGDSPH